MVVEANFVSLKHLPNHATIHYGSARTATSSLKAEGNKLFKTADITANPQKVLRHDRPPA
ncbi:MAG TPA: hypothetical protein DCL32_02080 [Gammaproteobacteria bacterium]|nr:hypothetical protein [Gammaproteobacteria bacterium]